MGKSAASSFVENETGSRATTGPASKFLFWVAFAWAAFQLWIASPLMFMFSDWLPVMNNIDTRSIHLSFALFLGYLSFPAFKSSSKRHIPIIDWILALSGVAVSMYLAINAVELSSVSRSGLPNTADLIVSAIGLILLVEASRRSLGPPLMVVALVFLAYVFFGHLAPEVIAWKGATISRAMSHMWLTQEGVFGVALGVSTTMVFLFVLFGSLLERAGAGNYFIWVAFSLLGHLRGGPAKAAVVSSALTGLVSGSSIGNVVTTGTFTIPLMRRVGFSAEKAGAIEVASSTNGQLTPPVMGAAAFLIIEFTGISYIEVVTHAFLPAIISYIALIYIVHIESCKANLKGLPRRNNKTIAQRALVFMTVVVGMVLLSLAVYFGLGWLKIVAGDATPWISALGFILLYIYLLKVATRHPELGRGDEINELPKVGPVVKSGLYFLLPVVVLIWCLAIERLSPALSVFWASVGMVFIILTHKYFKALMRNESNSNSRIIESWHDFEFGMVAGSRNMIGIAIATGTAGIIIGTVTLTGIGLVMAEVVELLSAGNLIIMLLLTAVISLLLGMGLPTTANYIVVSSLMAPVIVSVGAQSGLIVPLIAVHLFVFYFGILADDTPPVGLAAYAAAAISGGDPIRTGIQGFKYDIRTALLPFMFIFNTELLMIGISGAFHLALVISSAVMAMLLFAAATQGYFITKSKRWESATLLLVVFMLFRPGFFMNMIEPELKTVSATQIYELAGSLPDKAQIRVQVVGETFEGKMVDKIVMLPVGSVADGKLRLEENAGLFLREESGKMYVDDLTFGGVAERQKIDYDWEIASVQIKNERPAKQWFFIPALVLFALVWLSQLRRKTTTNKASA
jgi:TRAP transporter 4TM/12TM fusion protein